MPANDLIKTVADNIETLARERAKLKGGNGKAQFAKCVLKYQRIS